VLVFLTPVFYAPGTRGEPLETLVALNPLTHFLVAARAVLAGTPLSNPTSLVLAGLATLAAFVLAWRLFSVSENLIVEKLV